MCGISCTPVSRCKLAWIGRSRGSNSKCLWWRDRRHGWRPRGKYPKSDVGAHAADLAQAQYFCEGLRYLSGELRHLLGVVLTAQGLMPSSVRQVELEALVALLAELSQGAPESMQHELVRLLTLLQAALPHLVLFAPALDGLQHQSCQALGPQPCVCS